MTGRGADVEAEAAVVPDEHRRIAGRKARCLGGHQGAVGSVEDHRVDGITGDLGPVAALVQGPVMHFAEGDEVLERGVAPLRPVLDVMAVDEAVVGAAGEATALVPGL
jgi:hypothetical protein